MNDVSTKCGVVAVIGAPNAGKSSLLNALAQADTAIVTPMAGTTRDLIREHIVIDGLPVTLTDTAGLRDAPDQIEQEGIRRAQQALAQRQVLLDIVQSIGFIQNSTREGTEHPESIRLQKAYTNLLRMWGEI